MDVDLGAELNAEITHQQAVPEWRNFEVMAAAVAELEAAAPQIKAEFVAVMAAEGGSDAGGFSLDVENLTSTGAWRQRTYIKDGEVITHASGQVMMSIENDEFCVENDEMWY